MLLSSESKNLDHNVLSYLNIAPYTYIKLHGKKQIRQEKQQYWFKPMLML
jgi:hypothetical protein